MYQAFGFAPVGIRKKYYENVDDAIVMWVHEIDSPEYAARLAHPRGGHPRYDVVGGPGVSAIAPARGRRQHDHARHRDVVRRDGRRRRDGWPRRAVVGGVEPGGPARPVRRRGAGDRRSGPPRADHAGRGPGHRGVGHRRRPDRRRRRHHRPRAHRLAARRCRRGQGAGPRPGVCRSSASTTSRPTSTPPSSRTRRSSCRSSCCSSRVATRCSWRCGRTGEYHLLGQTIDDAAGEAFDKVARYLGPRLPGRPGHRPDRHAGRRRRPSPSPGRCSTRASTCRSAA